MAEPEVALVFTPDEWVEELHRHLTDHGGARVRQIVVEPEVALEETYDVLIVGHRWPALTHAFVAEVQARGRAVLGVFDREEPVARELLVAVGVDEVVESDGGADLFVQATRRLAARRRELVAEPQAGVASVRRGRIVAVGGPPGVGRTEVAVHLTSALRGVLVDADDVGPSVAPRLGLSVEPNIRTLIDAVEHGRGDVLDCVQGDASGSLPAVAGLPNAGAWVQLRPGEVVRVVEHLARDTRPVVVDGAGTLDDVGGLPRSRFGVARAIVVESDVVVGVCDATPAGVVRFLSWAVAVHALAGDARLVVAVNRAPAGRFRRAELYEELMRSLPASDVVFLADDRRVADAAWDGNLARKGPFTRGVAALAEAVRACTARTSEETPAGSQAIAS